MSEQGAKVVKLKFSFVDFTIPLLSQQENADFSMTIVMLLMMIMMTKMMIIVILNYNYVDSSNHENDVNFMVVMIIMIATAMVKKAMAKWSQ